MKHTYLDFEPEVSVDDDGGFYAVTPDYDGAPVPIGPDSYIGYGQTETEAIDDLKQQLSDYYRDMAADYGDFLYEQRKDRKQGL